MELTVRRELTTPTGEGQVQCRRAAQHDRQPDKRNDVKQPRKSDSNRAVVSMPKAVHRRLREVLDQVSLRGWSAFGIERRDPPSLGAIVDEAINVLMERMKQSQSKE